MLDAIVFPVSTDEFLSEYWASNFIHIPGESSKFGHLFSWQLLNRALEEHRFHEGRLRLYRSGARIETGLFMNGLRVDSRGLIRELAGGATLVFNSCEEVHRPLQELNTYLASLLHAHVFTNLYAGWRLDHGFPSHWDPQQVLILQIAGRKRWKVWKPTRMSPFRKDIVDTSFSGAPATSPDWEGILKPGELLHIPRGWWHAAHPLNEPCMHLTISVQNHTGIDLLGWLSESLKSSEAARMDLPVLATSEQRTQWLNRLKADLASSLDEDPISRFLAAKDAASTLPPTLSLPDDIPAEEGSKAKNLPLDGNSVLQMSPSRVLRVETVDGKAVCEAGGQRWPVDSDIGAQLLALNDGLPHRLSELSDPPDIRMSRAVALLLMRGIVKRIE